MKYWWHVLNNNNCWYRLLLATNLLFSGFVKKAGFLEKIIPHKEQNTLVLMGRIWFVGWKMTIASSDVRSTIANVYFTHVTCMAGWDIFPPAASYRRQQPIDRYWFLSRLHLIKQNLTILNHVKHMVLKTCKNGFQFIT